RSTRSVDAAQCAGWGRPRTSVPIRPTARCGSAARAFPSGTVNSPAGLEQGFTVERRPKGEGPLILEIAVGRARSTLSGDAVVFDTGVRKLSYGALAAVDDGGVPRPAYFALASADRLRIVVDDREAAYPLVIDPLLTGTADAQLESNQANAQLGIGVA